MQEKVLVIGKGLIYGNMKYAMAGYEFKISPDVVPSTIVHDNESPTNAARRALRESHWVGEVEVKPIHVEVVSGVKVFVLYSTSVKFCRGVGLTRRFGGCDYIQLCRGSDVLRNALPKLQERISYVNKSTSV